ncbi:hypothetical protein ACR820_08230 [Streptomyces netropsis]
MSVPRARLRLRGDRLRSRNVEVLGARLPALDGRGLDRLGCRRAAVGEGPYDAAGGIRHGRAHVQRAPRGRRGRRDADVAVVDGAGVPAAGLVRTALDHRLFHPGALGARHQQQVVLLGAVGGVEEGVGGVTGVGRGCGLRGVRLAGQCACVLRLSLARELAGVGHAYPSPIGSAPSNRSRP